MSNVYWADNALTPPQVAELLDYVQSAQGRFSAATTYPPTPGFREALILTKHKWHKLFLPLVEAHLETAREHLGLPAFEVGEIECQITATPAGGYFKRHTDNGQPNTATRRLAWLYYFWEQPKPFTGGELAIGREVIEPHYNGLAFFDAGQQHEVRYVSAPDGFMNSRFTVNGWVRAK